MPIDLDVFKKETDMIVSGLYQGIELGKNEKYDKAIESLAYAIISADKLMRIDPGIGKALRLDRTILVAKGLQLKAYVHKMEDEPENIEQIKEEIGSIAQGDLSFGNPYFAEIYGALEEWQEASKRGDFYTRPRED